MIRVLGFVSSSATFSFATVGIVSLTFPIIECILGAQMMAHDQSIMYIGIAAVSLASTYSYYLLAAGDVSKFAFVSRIFMTIDESRSYYSEDGHSKYHHHMMACATLGSTVIRWCIVGIVFAVAINVRALDELSLIVIFCSVFGGGLVVLYFLCPPVSRWFYELASVVLVASCLGFGARVSDSLADKESYYVRHSLDIIFNDVGRR